MTLLKENSVISFPSFGGDKNISKILSFINLGNGWDFGEGVAIGQNVIEKAINGYLQMSLFFKVSTFPTSYGGVTLSGAKGDNFYDITILPDKEVVEYRHEKGIGKEYDVLEELEDITLEQAVNRAFESQKLYSIKCILSEPLILKSTAEKREDSKVTHFNHSALHYPYLRINVQKPPAPPFATILTNTTNQPLRYQLFT